MRYSTSPYLRHAGRLEVLVQVLVLDGGHGHPPEVRGSGADGLMTLFGRQITIATHA